jgi:Skp family chaperone for outer membrane proteins
MARGCATLPGIARDSNGARQGQKRGEKAMKNWTVIGVLFLGIVIGSSMFGANGCKQEKSAQAAPEKSEAGSGSAAAIGVVDVNKVVNDLGWANELNSNLTNLQNQLTTELRNVTATYESQLQQKKKELGLKETDSLQDIGKKITPQQQQELVVMFNTGRQLLVQLQQAAGQQFENYRQQWFQQWREALNPIVKQVAQDKKLTVVFSTPGPILYTDPAADVTAAVIDAAKMHPPTFKPVQLPQIKVPLSIDPAAAATQPTTQPVTQPSLGTGTGSNPGTNTGTSSGSFLQNLGTPSSTTGGDKK